MLSLVQFSIFFYLKSTINNLKFLSYADYFKPVKIEVIEDVEEKVSEPKEIFIEKTIINNTEIKDQMILNKSLKHLDFISSFEMYLEDKNYKKFPIEFLQEFEKIKAEAQLSTLKISDQLNNSVNKAA